MNNWRAILWKGILTSEPPLQATLVELSAICVSQQVIVIENITFSVFTRSSLKHNDISNQMNLSLKQYHISLDACVMFALPQNKNKIK